MRRAIQTLRRNPKLLLIGLLAVSVTFVAGGNAKVHADDCSTNAIITCGLGDGSTSSQISNFISKLNTGSGGNDGHGHTDLRAIYSYYNLVPAQYSKFVASAEAGTAYRDGHIEVNGQTVGTGPGFSIGRDKSAQGSSPQSRTIPGAGTFWGNTNAQSFAPDHASLPVLVMFDSKGVMLFAVITTCGNPITATPVVPSYSCNTLQQPVAVAGQKNTYKFTAVANNPSNAKIISYTFNFGDGTAPQVVPSTSTSVSVNHTYTKTGPMNVSVQVTVSLPGGATATVTSAPCAKTLTIATPPPPPAPKVPACSSLDVGIIDGSKYDYNFTANASVPAGNTFTGADFNFGDNSPIVKGVLNGTMATSSHIFPNANVYTITATLHFNQSGKVVNVTCAAKTPPAQCQDTVAPFCHPCATNPAYAASDSAHCTTSLPNTGAGDVIAIFGAVVVAGFLIFRQFIYRKNIMQTNGAVVGLTDHPVHGETVEPSVDENPTLVQQVHRNHQGLNHGAHYQHPHRFRPRSHQDK